MIKRITHVILILGILLTVAFPCCADFQPDSDRMGLVWTYGQSGPLGRLIFRTIL